MSNIIEYILQHIHTSIVNFCTILLMNIKQVNSILNVKYLLIIFRIIVKLKNLSYISRTKLRERNTLIILFI